MHVQHLSDQNPLGIPVLCYGIHYNHPRYNIILSSIETELFLLHRFYSRFFLIYQQTVSIGTFYLMELN